MEIPRITVADVHERIARGEPVVFLDARSPAALERATDQLPGSLRVPADAVDRHVPQVGRETTLVAYCT